VVAAVKVEGLSRRAAAARFSISYSAAIQWLKLFDETGSEELRRRLQASEDIGGLA